MSGSILITEADPDLLLQFEKAMPERKLVSLGGTLDLALVDDLEAVEALCVTVRSPIGRAEMDAMPNLRVIATGSAGYDHIDVHLAAGRGVAVFTVPRYGPAVAEFNIALMLSLSRKVHLGYMRTLQRDFSLADLLGRNLDGRTLGLIGTGNIGLRVAQLALAFGMKVIAVDPQPNSRFPAPYVDLDTLLRSSDFIAVCCPLNEQTQHMIGNAEFAKMKRGMLIVNTSRGAVMDTQALVWALNEGIVDGAALDVLEGESMLSQDALLRTLGSDPSPEETQSVAEDLTLMRHPQVIVTPHMAYYTQDSLAEIRAQTVENIKNFLNAGVGDLALSN